MGEKKIDPNAHLIDGLRDRDRQVQYEVYQLYSKAMFNTALRITGGSAEAEDVLQEAFLAAFTSIDRFQGQSTFGAWLKRIVVNKSINAVNKRKASLVSMDQAPEDIPSDSKEEDQLPLWNVEQIMKAVDQLPDGYRIVFSLYLLEGYDHREIAQVLGITEGGSKSQYNRAKKKLQDLLNEQRYV